MQVGDEIETWFSDTPSGKSRILDIRPYRGKYPEFFTHMVVVTAPRIRAGKLEMAVNEKEFRE